MSRVSFTASWSPVWKIDQDLTWPWRAGGERSCSDSKYPARSQCICIKLLSGRLCPSVLRHVRPVTRLTQSKTSPTGRALTLWPNTQRSRALQPVQRWLCLHQIWWISCYSCVCSDLIPSTHPHADWVLTPETREKLWILPKTACSCTLGIKRTSLKIWTRFRSNKVTFISII